jgi:hypothetical protein
MAKLRARRHHLEHLPVDRILDDLFSDDDEEFEMLAINLPRPEPAPVKKT